ncbi:hypothetical protein ACF1AY_15930 [Streptomyces sp. NPDC014776]|uniref:hypothetical protein n=1 Tax=unclassified Streptomyces TaxID=2593676 RepID=UPI00370336C8
MARLRQAGTGEKYTEALRAVQEKRPTQFREFCARGAGWDPITQRAAQELKQVWPTGPAPYWEEKFGDLCWKTFPRWEAPAAAVSVLQKALTEAAGTCQTCPSPGRKRVIWTWDDEYGWIQPWVKTCCDACYWVPRKLLDNQQYRDLFERYEEPLPDPGSCCIALEEVISVVRTRFDQGGVPAVLAKLAELCQSMGSRSPHHDPFSGHALLLSAQYACTQMVVRTWQAGRVAGPLVSEPAERRRILQALGDLAKALHATEAEQLRD